MKILVAGTSNIGAVKYAVPQIKREYPSAELSFFGLPGGKFAEACARRGVFGVHRSATRDAIALARRINGMPRLVLADYDHVVLIADTLGLASCLWMAVHYDVVDWPSRRGLPLVSETAFLAAMRHSIVQRADVYRKQFETTPLIVNPAPHPTSAVVKRGKHFQRPYADMWDHPEAARVKEHYRRELTDVLAARDMELLLQPEETIERPFLTKLEFGVGSLDFRREDTELNDHRHMNADFGASLFRSLALRIGLEKATAPEDEPEEG